MSVHHDVLRTLIVGVCLCSVAYAAPKDDARRYFVAGLEAARAEQYEVALENFLSAQAAYPHPATLYNIARAYADLEKLDKAIEYYELFAQAEPEKAEDVEPIIRVLRARMNQEVSETPSSTGGTVSGAELERLNALARELAAITDALRQQADAEPPGDPSTETGDPGVDRPEGAEGEEILEEFLSEAYERVVVTASRYGQSPLDSPSTISVITAQDIRTSGATNIPDLLRRAVGVEVMSLAAAQPEVSIRGFNREISNKVLILVDGRSVYQDILATPLWGSLQIPLDLIDRIEITRGPGSAVYGANAVTGVVNIITKIPGEGKNIVRVEGGQPGYGKANAMTTGRSGRNSYRFSGGWHSTGRWSTEIDPEETPAITLFGEDDDVSLNVLHATGRVDRTFSDRGLISASGGHLEGATEFYTIGALGNYELNNVKSSYAQLDVGWDPVLLRVFYNGLNGNAGAWYGYSEPKQLPTVVNSDVLDAELSGVFDFETGTVTHRLSAGAGYRYKNIAWTYLDGDGAPIIENHFRAFVQEDARVGDVSFVGALRFDRHPLVDLQETISPRGAIVWRMRETTSLRVTSGTSFRNPSFAESYIDLEQPNANPQDGIYVTSSGNQDLVPERVFTAEIGVRDESSNIHTADATVYVNRVSNLIGLTDVVPTLDFYDDDDNGYQVGLTGFGNLESIYTGYGLELDGHLFPVTGLDLQANLHLQEIIEDDGAGNILDDQSASLAKFNANVAYSTPFRLDVSAGVHLVSAQTWRLRDFSQEDGSLIESSIDIPARAIPYGRLAVRLLDDESLEIAGVLWNPVGLVEEERFQEHPKGQLVGGRAYGSVTYRF
ncbi:MAG: TonB-dependent receptor [Myxococcota bacterium]